MPVILRIKGFKFYFYRNEGEEPMHIHVNKAENNGKIWLEPQIQVEYFYGFKSKEIKEIMDIIIKNIDKIKTSWNEHFKQI